MTLPDDNERELRDLFSAARRADTEEAPSFHETLRAARATPDVTPLRGTRRGFRFAFAGAAASAAIAGFAFWLVLQEPMPAPPLDVALADERAAAPPPVLPKSTAPVAKIADRVEPPGSSDSGQVAAAEVPKNELKEKARDSDDKWVTDLPTAGRNYQHVLTTAAGVADSDGDGGVTVHGSRERDFKTTAGGVSDVDPLAGRSLSNVNPNSIEERAVITSGKGVGNTPALGSVPGGFPPPLALQRQVASHLEGVASIGTAGVPIVADDREFNTEGYRAIAENSFLSVTENPLSTFSIDVDTGSYSNVRRFLNAGALPPRDAVRIEELLNYFTYDDPPPSGSAPFSARIEIADCPWAPAHRLARIGLKGRTVARGEVRGSNLVFLIDVSGSMNEPAKLPLLKSALALLIDQLQARDRVALVVYAGASGLVLPSTAGSARAEIRAALDRLSAGGGTNGASGLALAYQVARENFVRGGINRVILATDGDFNLGPTSESELLGLIEKDAKNGIFLTTLGFGTGNYKDDRLEALADKGNGAYAYIDTIHEARKVLVEQVEGTLVTIAKDVKIQIEFNPAEVGAYRLIGYENRMLRKEDFNDDTKDAGEIGAGHSVTALYELVPPGTAASRAPAVDPLKYQAPATPRATAEASPETLTLKLRYKQPDAEESRLLSFPVIDNAQALSAASPDFKFAAAVAGFGMILRDSEHRGAYGFDDVHALALAGVGVDASGYRGEFLSLVRRAQGLLPPIESD